MRILHAEGRMWRSLLAWARTDRPDGVRTFGYGRQVRPLLYAVCALAVVEGVVIDFLIGLVTSSATAAIVAAVIHVYALCWLLGIVASLRTRPHALDDGRLVLRNSVFSGLDVPLSAIETAEVCRVDGSGFSGVEVDGDSRTATLRHGDATVRLHVRSLEIAGVVVDRLDVTADDPAALVRAVRGAHTA
ncbi:hypothetical protein ACQ7HM_01285 [Williamsia sp. MIQD14]|uniref:hypothetical protein n=1 Tax=Williamsia sp. MIQD14 TaxID=3425703 RepID=UPI003DA19F84